MKLPRMTAHLSLKDGAWEYAPIGGRGAARIGGIAPQVTQEERDESRQFINNNCHGLQRCNGGEDCNTLRDRGQTANQCVWHRFRVRQYYIEQGGRDPGRHQDAIVWDDNVAQSCLAAYNQNCVA